MQELPALKHFLLFKLFHITDRKHSILFYTYPLPGSSLSPNAGLCQPCFQESVISVFIQRASSLNLAQSAHLSEEHT